MSKLHTEHTHGRALSRLVAFLFIGSISVGCSSQLPASTPDAMGLIADRVELNAIANYAALDNVLINAQFSKKDVNGVSKLLGGIDSTTLSAADKTNFDQAVSMLSDIETGLTPSAEITTVRDGLKVNAGEIVAHLRQIQGIIAEKVGQDEIMNNIVTKVRGAVEGDKDNG